MKNSKIIFIFIFFITIIIFYLNLDINYWFLLSFVYLLLLINYFIKALKVTVPFLELFSLVYLIESVIAVILIYWLDNHSLNDVRRYYMQIPINVYLPYGLLASEAFFIGVIIIDKPNKIWSEYIINFTKLIKQETVIKIIVFSLFGYVIGFLRIQALNYVLIVISKIGLCALVGLYLSEKSKKSYLYLYAGILLNLIGVIKTGMFTSFTLFIILLGLIYFVKNSVTKTKINGYLIFMLMTFGLVLMAFIQNTKEEFRKDAWSDIRVEVNDNLSKEYLLNSLANNFNKINVLDKSFYLPMLYRVNQGWLVSCTMEKIPGYAPYSKGETIVTALKDGLLPRVLNSSKQSIGVDRIYKYTNLQLEGNTSMSIGYLGESYVNFGVVGGVLCMGCMGLLLSFLERKALIFSKKNPLILIVLPFYFMTFLTSGNDFFWLFNNLTMGTIIIFIVISYLKEKK